MQVYFLQPLLRSLPIQACILTNPYQFFFTMIRYNTPIFRMRKPLGRHTMNHGPWSINILYCNGIGDSDSGVSAKATTTVDPFTAALSVRS